MVTAEKAKSRRTASREQRRQQLIDATMKCIGRKGLTGTTLSDVAKEAGLSQGIVNLHFESKENLLTETLLSLADEYRTQFDKALNRAGPAVADKLQAVLEHDLRPSVLDRSKLAVWFAFWGEVKSRPTYRKICDAHDRYYDEVVANLCDELIDEGDYGGISGTVAAEALMSMSNGLWLGCLLSPQNWDRQLARDAVGSYLKNVFPKHFKDGGK
jgi:TetR/AcrR family transcriptional repressor of bet genes